MSYSSTILADSPTFWYRLDEASGTTMADSSGNSNPGTYSASNVTYNVTGAILGDTDKAVTFASTGQANAASGIIPSGSFSMECWYKTASNISASTSIMANYSSNGGFTATFGAGFAGSATNKIVFSVANNSELTVNRLASRSAPPLGAVASERLRGRRGKQRTMPGVAISFCRSPLPLSTRRLE